MICGQIGPAVNGKGVWPVLCGGLEQSKPKSRNFYRNVGGLGAQRIYERRFLIEINTDDRSRLPLFLSVRLRWSLPAVSSSTSMRIAEGGTGQSLSVPLGAERRRLLHPGACTKCDQTIASVLHDATQLLMGAIVCKSSSVDHLSLPSFRWLMSLFFFSSLPVAPYAGALTVMHQSPSMSDDAGLNSPIVASLFSMSVLLFSLTLSSPSFFLLLG